jgi:hypothetical protein
MSRGLERGWMIIAEKIGIKRHLGWHSAARRKYVK